jgi:TRAP-type C4-dicarboxylate transport system permease large subunit
MSKESDGIVAIGELLGIDMLSMTEEQLLTHQQITLSKLVRLTVANGFIEDKMTEDSILKEMADSVDRMDEEVLEGLLRNIPMLIHSLTMFLGMLDDIGARATIRTGVLMSAAEENDNDEVLS